jgi:hypothetical protein
MEKPSNNIVGGGLKKNIDTSRNLYAIQATTEETLEDSIKMKKPIN